MCLCTRSSKKLNEQPLQVGKAKCYTWPVLEIRRLMLFIPNEMVIQADTFHFQ